ncbi:alpha/beta hydrolase [Paraburkholderia silviterrae]|nr:alpha/beta hydrolase [Paraburkholderia silviterrae]
MPGPTLPERYSPAQCEANYNLRARHPNALELMAGWQRHAASARATLEHYADERFGESAHELIDVFPAARRDAPAVMFIHGGYWQAGDKHDVSFVAPLLVRSGICVAINNYALAPGASLDTMVAQTLNALHWLHRHAGRFGIDANRIYVMGHSAGGHLAAMMLTTHGAANGMAAPVRGAIALSGLFDLVPLVDTSINRALGLNEANAKRLSPARIARHSDAPIHMLVGEGETRGFHEQRTLLSSQWQGVHALPPVPRRHHYDILEIFREPGNAWLDSIVGIVRAATTPGSFL